MTPPCAKVLKYLKSVYFIKTTSVNLRYLVQYIVTSFFNLRYVCRLAESRYSYTNIRSMKLAQCYGLHGHLTTPFLVMGFMKVAI